MLVGFGTDVVEPLAHFLHDQAEDVWVRRHLPATLARLPSQRTLDVLVDALSDRDGFLRYKAITAIEDAAPGSPGLAVRARPIEALAMAESLRYFDALTLHANLTHGETSVRTRCSCARWKRSSGAAGSACSGCWA